jgi:hypothetical protein
MDPKRDLLTATPPFLAAKHGGEEERPRCREPVNAPRRVRRRKTMLLYIVMMLVVEPQKFSTLQRAAPSQLKHSQSRAAVLTFITTQPRDFPPLPTMTKKKRRQNPEIDELLARPWCYYCERDFEDLKILIHHQKAKHFKCDRCARRLNTAGGEL